jgi:N-acetylglucosamine-6-phosphate deacetylase
MRPLHHRDSGLADLCLVDDRLSAEVIPDGVHLSTPSLQLAHRAKQDKLIAITDAISATGKADGDYVLGELEVTSFDGVATLRGTKTLAGSTLTMNLAFDHLITHVGLDILSAVNATSTSPAKALGLDNVGSITVGKAADFVVWDSKLHSVWRKGEIL